LELQTVLENRWALVVEDDAHSLVAMTSILRDLGVNFKRNTTGANVTEQMRAMDPLPDFVLLNIDLPNGGAFAIHQKIQSDPAARGIPVIAVGATVDLRQQARRSGFAGFIPKPLPRRQFGEILQRILDGDNFWDTAV
jgi:CheY-like chemotaxis protein